MRFTSDVPFRIYFNRHSAAPLVWCVAGPGYELALAELVVRTPVTYRYRPKETPDDEDGKPSAWCEAAGTLVIDSIGRAELVPAGSDDPRCR